MKLIDDALATVTHGEPNGYKNLSITPLLGEHKGEPDYLTLDEALTAGAARVSEISKEGSVPELLFENQSNKAVLLIDGEELVGAKQNRILNLSIFVPAKATVTIPVSCVEARRWRQTSTRFSSEQRAYYSAGRARKAAQVTDSLRLRRSRRSNQAGIWEDIAQKSARMGSRSDTGAMASMYSDNAASLSEHTAAFTAQTGQVGAIFSINDRIRGLELFDYPLTFSKVFSKLVGSYALDAIDGASSHGSDDAVSAAEFVDSVRKAEGTLHPALAEGQDVRLSGPFIAGGALVAWQRIIHLCAFHLDAAGNGAQDTGTILRRASLRRRRFTQR